MSFKLDNELVQETCAKYNGIVEILNNKKEEINVEIQTLLDKGWSGNSKDAFTEKHKQFNEQYSKFVEKVTLQRDILNNNIHPKAENLLTICNGFINCFEGEDAIVIPNRSGSFVPSLCGSSNNTKLFLDYEGKDAIKSSIDGCSEVEYPLITKYLGEIQDLEDELLYSTLNISGEIEASKAEVKKENDILLSFLSEYNKYYSGVEEFENSAVAEFGQITGITSPSVFFNTNLDLCKNGKWDIDIIKRLINKEIALEPLSAEERQTLDYIKRLLGTKEYNQIKEVIMTGSGELDNMLVNSMLNNIINNNLEKIEFEKERIVISGNKTSDSTPQIFIDTAIKQIKEWKEKGDGNITWMIDTDGYTEAELKEIENIAQMYGVNLKYISSLNDITNHINGTDGEYDRDRTKITDVSIFAHGLRNDGGTLDLDHEVDNGINNITSNELLNSNINRNAFSNVHTFFGSCNMGTVTEGRSFAEEWVKKTGGIAQAVCDPTPYSVPGVEGDVDNTGGQVSFEGINNQDLISKLKRIIQIDHFSINGCDNYPDIDYNAPALFKEEEILDKNGNTIPKNSDVYWEEISEDGTIKRVSSGGPRK